MKTEHPNKSTAKTPIEEVNPSIGTISHILVPVFPVTQRPHAMMRLVPPNHSPRTDLTDGAQMLLISHRGKKAFRIMPLGQGAPADKQHTDHTHNRPDVSRAYFEESRTTLSFSTTEHCAFFKFECECPTQWRLLIEPRGQGKITADSKRSGIFLGTDSPLDDGAATVYCAFQFDTDKLKVIETGSRFVIEFLQPGDIVCMRCACSYIDHATAVRFLNDEIIAKNLSMETAAAETRDEWNHELGKVRIWGGSEDRRTVFRTAMFRCRERMVRVSEYGRYHSPWDGHIHSDGGVPFWTDDWTWDTFRALHPLNCILQPEEEHERLVSYLRMAEQSGAMPIFPSPLGDGHAMTGMHPCAIFLDAFVKNIINTDEAKKAFELIDKTFKTRSILAWYKGPRCELDSFFWENGFLPALREGEKETFSQVHKGERRQSVAVTLDLSFDIWCLAKLAELAGITDGAEIYRKHALDYMNLWKQDTGFFHPKSDDGKWIEPFDYSYSGGQGARDYYAENNGWTYNWAAPHALDFIIGHLGGPGKAAQRLDRLFEVPPSCSLWDYYKQFPDATGLVGEFAMGNEPSMHIPYIYNIVGQPWKTQKHVRMLLDLWWRNDLMGVCGDDDGGGLSAWAVFSMLGLYPVTPGIPEYQITSPVFEKSEWDLGDGRVFTILAPGASDSRKYIRTVRVNGQNWNRTSLPHSIITGGGTLEIELSDRPDYNWGVNPD